MTNDSTNEIKKGFYYPRLMNYNDTIYLLNMNPAAQALLDQASGFYYCQGLDISQMDFETLMATLAIDNTDLYAKSFNLFQKRWPSRKVDLDKSLAAIKAKSKTYSDNGAKGGRPKKFDSIPIQERSQVNENVYSASNPAVLAKPFQVVDKNDFDVAPEVEALFNFIKKGWHQDRIREMDIFDLDKVLKYYSIDTFKENVKRYLIWRDKKEQKDQCEFKGYDFSSFISKRLFENYNKKYQGKSKQSSKDTNNNIDEDGETIKNDLQKRVKIYEVIGEDEEL